MDAKEYFTDNEAHDPNSIIIGQRVSKTRCIKLMESYHQSKLPQISEGEIEENIPNPEPPTAWASAENVGFRKGVEWALTELKK